MDQEYPKIRFFGKTENIIQNAKTQKLAKISDTPFDQRSLIYQKVWFQPYFVRQNQQKTNFFFAHRFKTTSKQKISNLRPRLIESISPEGRCFKKSELFCFPRLQRRASSHETRPAKSKPCLGRRGSGALEEGGLPGGLLAVPQPR